MKPIESSPTTPVITTGTAAGVDPPPTLTNEQIQQFRQFFESNDIMHVGADGQLMGPDGQILDPPTMSPDDALAILMALQAKLGDESKNTALEGVQHNKDSQKTAREEQMKKLLEAAAEMKKSQESGLIGQIFGWIGAAVAIIAAVAVTIATFGAAAPASGLAIAGVIAALTGAVLAGTTQIVSSIPGAMKGMGEEGSKAFMFTMMALQIACAVVSIGAGAASAGGAASTAADTATDTATTAADLATKAGKIETVAEQVGKGAQIGQGVTEVGEGASSIASAEYQKQADYDKADLAEIVKWLKAIAAQDDQAIEFIKALQDMQDKGWGTVVSVSKEHIELQQSLAQNLQSGHA